MWPVRDTTFDSRATVIVNTIHSDIPLTKLTPFAGEWLERIRKSGKSALNDEIIDVCVQWKQR